MLYRQWKTAVVVVLLVIVSAPGALVAGEYNAVLDIGAPMPGFASLPATDGSKLSSSDLDEEVVILVFLANHCPWVKGMDGDLVNLVDSFEGKDVRVVGVSVNHREEDRLPAMVKHAANASYNFTYVFDESQELGRQLGATRTPEYFVFDEDRKLVYMGLLHNSPAAKRRDGNINYTQGEPTDFYVSDAVAEVLAGKSVSVAETRAHGCSVEYEQPGS
ncbi:MAG: thioredoxin family protein [Thermoanaerobaculia bacterium]